MTLDTALCVGGLFFVCLLVHWSLASFLLNIYHSIFLLYFLFVHMKQSYWVTQVNLELEFPLRKSRLCWDPKHGHVPLHKAIPFLKAFAHSLGNNDTKYSDISAYEYVAHAHMRWFLFSIAVNILVEPTILMLRNVITRSLNCVLRQLKMLLYRNTSLWFYF